MIIYKAISKAEFAADAGITLTKLREWLNASQKEMEKFELAERGKILPPVAVKFLSEKYQVFPHNAVIM